jgi:hypothetical protein
MEVVILAVLFKGGGGERTGADSDNKNKILCLILFIGDAIFTILLINGNKLIMQLFIVDGKVPVVCE